MADLLRIKRRPTTGATGAPSSLLSSEIAFNEADRTLYYGLDNAGGVTTNIIPIGGPGAFLPLVGGNLSGPLNIDTISAVRWPLNIFSNGGPLPAANFGASFGFNSVTAGWGALDIVNLYPSAFASFQFSQLNSSGTANVLATIKATGVIEAISAKFARDPTDPMEAVTLQYLQANTVTIANGDARWVNVIGDTMQGMLTLAVDPSGVMDAVTKRYSDRNKVTGYIDVTANSVQTADQSDYGYFYLYGNNTVPTTVTMAVPAGGRTMWNFNNTSAQPVTIAAPGGGWVTVLPSGGMAHLFSDSVNVNFANSVGFTRPPGESSAFLATTEFVTRATGVGGPFLPIAGGTMQGGISFGSMTDPDINSMANHITLHVNGYGFGVSNNGRLNYHVDAGGTHAFMTAGVDKLTVNANTTLTTNLFTVANQSAGPPNAGGGGSLTWNTDGSGDFAFVNLCNWAAAGFRWYQVLSPSGWRNLAYLRNDGTLFLLTGPGVSYTLGGASTNAIGFSWTSGAIHGWVDGGDQGALALQSWASGAFLPITGGTLQGNLILPVSTLAAPSLSFSGSPTYGIFFTSPNIGFTTAGAVRLYIGTTRFTSYLPFWSQSGTVAAPTYTFSSDTTSGLYLKAVGSVSVAAAGGEVMNWVAGGVTVATNKTMTLGMDPVGLMEAVTLQYLQAHTPVGSNYVAKIGDSMSGPLQINWTPTDTAAQLWLRPAAGNSGTSNIRFGGTFAPPTTDYGPRYITSIRSGMVNAWSTEYLDIWINNGGSNDGNSDAAQAQVARFTLGTVTFNYALHVKGQTSLDAPLGSTSYINMNNGVAPSNTPQDLSRGIILWGSTSAGYGFAITSGTLNYNTVGAASAHDFYSDTRLLFRIKDGGAGVTSYVPLNANNNLSVTGWLGLANGTTYLSFLGNLGGGAYNPIMQANDAVALANRGAVDTGALTLMTWSNSALGIRIDGAAHSIAITAANGVTVGSSLLLTHDPPTAGNEATTKNYVDSKVGGGLALIRVNSDVSFDLDTISGSTAIGSFTGFQGAYSLTNQAAGLHFPTGSGNSGGLFTLVGSNAGWVSQLFMGTGIWARWNTGQGTFNAWSPVVLASGATMTGVLTTTAGLRVPSGGLSFGTDPTASSAVDLSRHISLYDGWGGFSITGGSLNVVAGGSVQMNFTGGYANMAVPLYMTHDPPTNGNEVATKNYVDAKASAVVVASIAALRALTAGTATVYVQGYYAAGDGGGGDYVLGASGTDNGGSIIKTTSGNFTYYLQTYGQPVSVKQFGAKGDNATNDGPAVNAALAAGSSITFPPATYLTSVALNIVRDGTHIIGAGRNSTQIISTSTTAPLFSFAANLTSVAIEHLTLSRNVTATNGADGISCPNYTQFCRLSNLVIMQNWRGLKLGPTGYSYIDNVISIFNLDDGFNWTNTATNGAMQWSLTNCLSTQNGSRGYYLFSSPGPGAVALGEILNCSTYANVGVGFAAVGLPAVPINGIRMTGGLYGQDGNSELYFDTYGGDHKIIGVYAELAGTSPTGPTLGTPATHAGAGFLFTANNADALCNDCHSEGNSNSGFITSATEVQFNSCKAINNGASTSADRTGFYQIAGRSSFFNVRAGNIRGSISQQQGIYLNNAASGVLIWGADLTGNTTATLTVAAGLTGLTMGGMVPSGNLLLPNGGILVGNAGNGAIVGGINVATDIQKNGTTYNNP